MVKEAETDPLAAVLKAFAHPKRLHLLKFLAEPHSLEEIASELKVARQTAQEHVDQLVAVGALQSTRGRRDHGPVTEHAVVLPRLFEIHEQFGSRLGVIDRDLDERVVLPQRTAPLAAAASPSSHDGLPRLTIVHGMRIGETTLLEGAGPWPLGRDVFATISLGYDPYASARHAEVRRTREGFEVADAFSSNGTFVDWAPLGRGGTAPLRNGSLLRVGKTLLLFRSEGTR